MLCFDWDLFVHVCESRKDALQTSIQNLQKVLLSFTFIQSSLLKLLLFFTKICKFCSILFVNSIPNLRQKKIKKLKNPKGFIPKPFCILYMFLWHFFRN